MTIYDDLCDTCGTYVDPIGGDNAITGTALGMDEGLLFCCRAHADDFEETDLAAGGCSFCGAADYEDHEPGCYLYEDDADPS